MRIVARLLAVALSVVVPTVPGTGSAADAVSRIKDIADVVGVRDNMLVGYGLVVGLAGTGDKLNKAPFTKESLIGMLERLGINTREGNLDNANVAAVMVTAKLPPFARPGSRIDVTVSALGDSKSLLGGTLVVTPLLGADSNVYAVAQGGLAVGGFAAGGQGATVTKGVPTSGRIPNGAIVEKSVEFSLQGLNVFTVALRSPDFTTASRIAVSINGRLGAGVSRPLDSGTVEVTLPAGYPGGAVALITELEQIEVTADTPARVIVNEETGVVVIGQNVRISPVAVAQGSLTVRVTETPQVSQPQPFSQAGQTTVVPRTQIEVNESGTGKVALLNRGTTLQDLVDGLNALGVGPRDLISILQALKTSGALRADLEVM